MIFQTLRVFISACLVVAIFIALLYLSDFLLPKREYSYSGDMLYHRDESGYAIFRPNSQFQETLRVKDKIIFQKTYTTDQYGMRVTPPPNNPDCVKSHLMMIGASFVFGYGLSDHETLPYQLSQELSCTRVFNFGIIGAGLNQRLYALNQLNTLPIDTPGLGVYYFVETEFSRVIGSMLNMTRWKGHAPCYQLDDKKQPILSGTFNQCRPWRAKFIASFAPIHFFKYEIGPRFKLKTSF